MNTRATTRNLNLTRIAAAATVALAGFLSTAASASDIDCFPLCPESTTQEQKEITAPAETCGNSLVDKAESLNNKLKPAKEIAGYIRSPQGLAIKMVNDHVVKIPAWVGYAMDPVGSLKNRAIGEVRSRVKEQLLPARNCTAPALEDTPDNWERLSV